MENILQFLEKLKANNHKDWFDANRAEYENSKKDFEAFLEIFIQNVAKFDIRASYLKPKDCIFRINRDVRFSKDKSPYKTHFGAVLAEGGRKSIKPCYYLHIEPNNCFLAGGSWMPEADYLKKIRQEIAYNGENFVQILENQAFRDNFSLDSECKLRTVPKGYEKTNPYADFLKHKSFTITHLLESNKISAENLTEKCKIIQPFLQFLDLAFEDFS